MPQTPLRSVQKTPVGDIFDEMLRLISAHRRTPENSHHIERIELGRRSMMELKSHPRINPFIGDDGTFRAFMGIPISEVSDIEGIRIVPRKLS